MSTKIEWCDETLNPIQDVRKGKSGRGYHCTKCSPGCQNCYAERINKIRGNGLPFDNSPVEFELIQSELNKPLKWKKPRSIFVQSMGDLCHEDVPTEFIDDVVERMYCTSNHKYLILSKRPERMRGYCESLSELCHEPLKMFESPRKFWPFDHVYLGLTVCNQQEADEKIPVFLQVPGKKFLSIEPMLGPIDLSPWLPHFLDFSYSTEPARIEDGVILGGETGPEARPMHPDWVRSVRDQCAAAGVPFFLKHVSKEDGRVLDGRTHDDLAWRSHEMF